MNKFREYLELTLNDIIFNDYDDSKWNHLSLYLHEVNSRILNIKVPYFIEDITRIMVDLLNENKVTNENFHLYKDFILNESIRLYSEESKTVEDVLIESIKIKC